MYVKFSMFYTFKSEIICLYMHSSLGFWTYQPTLKSDVVFCQNLLVVIMYRVHS